MIKKATQIVFTLIIVGVISIATALIVMVIAWAPVIDRLARPCHYYPQMFVDCVDER